MSQIPYYLAAGFIGGLVGAVEIFQRYKAEPFKAIFNKWGTSYILFNSLAAVVAYYVVVLAKGMGPDTASLAKLQWSTLSGFGAAAILHSKLLSIRIPDGKEVALGPEIVVQTFLSVIDRQLDRTRAKDRYTAVRRLMENIDFEKAKIRLPLQIFQAMQGVTEEESNTLVARIAEIDEMEGLSSQDKSYILGFYLLDLVGERFLSEILPEYIDDFILNQAIAENP
jgi:hypothetical protein